MRRLTTILGMVGLVSLGAVSGSTAAPVPGFDALYSANFTSCTLPDGTLAACEAAINAHVDALIAGGVDQATSNSSFTALRSEVFTANAADSAFQAAIDALFESLLPDSGAIGAPGVGGGAPTGTPASISDGSDGAGTPASPF